MNMRTVRRLHECPDETSKNLYLQSEPLKASEMTEEGALCAIFCILSTQYLSCYIALQWHSCKQVSQQVCKKHCKKVLVTGTGAQRGIRRTVQASKEAIIWFIQTTLQKKANTWIQWEMNLTIPGGNGRREDEKNERPSYSKQNTISKSAHSNARQLARSGCCVLLAGVVTVQGSGGKQSMPVQQLHLSDWKQDPTASWLMRESVLDDLQSKLFSVRPVNKALFKSRRFYICKTVVVGEPISVFTEKAL